MQRADFAEKINNAFQVNPIVALLGPRQCGKTTLAKQIAQRLSYETFPPENYFDLESLTDLRRLEEPELALSSLKGLIIIDEIQRHPTLFQALRVLVDKPNLQQQFLILGSASRELINHSAESLTGRISYIELTPFNYTETHDFSTLWLRGGFPKSYLATSDEVSFHWRKEYIRTFLEQDVPNLGFKITPQNLQRYWFMLAHYHGNIFNASELGRSLGLSHNTVRHYLDILCSTLMMRELHPWHENISKRQVKSPKIYFRDSGIYHELLGISSKSSLLCNPKLGASWEGVVLEEVIRYMKVDNSHCYFWATHADAELDLLIFYKGKRWGFEIKYTNAPSLSRSMQIALTDLNIEKLFVLTPGEKSYSLAGKIRVVPIKDFLNAPLGYWFD